VLPDTGDYPIAAETCVSNEAWSLSSLPSARSKFLFLVLRENPMKESNLHALDLDWIIVWDNLISAGDST